jgi:hypothetical protein
LSDEWQQLNGALGKLLATNTEETES